jgi:molybdopterin converting factor small subunit
VIGKKVGRLDLKLYASVKDLLGKDTISVDYTQNMTVGDLRKTLYSSFPILSSVKAQFAVSINRRAVGDSELIHMTDELALLPPVSGG